MIIMKEMKMPRRLWIRPRKVTNQLRTLSQQSVLRALKAKGNNCLLILSSFKRELTWWGKEEHNISLLKLSLSKLTIKLSIKPTRNMFSIVEKSRLIRSWWTNRCWERESCIEVPPQTQSFDTTSTSTWRTLWDFPARKTSNCTFSTSTACYRKKVVRCLTLRPREVSFWSRTTWESCSTRRWSRMSSRGTMSMSTCLIWKT